MEAGNRLILLVKLRAERYFLAWKCQIVFFCSFCELKRSGVQNRQLGGGDNICIKISMVGPNDLNFFSSKTWAQTGFARFGGRNFYRQHLRNFYRITFEIRDFGRKWGEKSTFWFQNLLPVEILRVPNFWKLKSMASQLHFALWINIVASKLKNLVLVKVGGFWVKMTQILDFGIFGVWHH